MHSCGLRYGIFISIFHFSFVRAIHQPIVQQSRRFCVAQRRKESDITTCTRIGWRQTQNQIPKQRVFAPSDNALALSIIRNRAHTSERMFDRWKRRDAREASALPLVNHQSSLALYEVIGRARARHTIAHEIRCRNRMKSNAASTCSRQAGAKRRSAWNACRTHTHSTRPTSGNAFFARTAQYIAQSI